MSLIGLLLSAGIGGAQETVLITQSCTGIPISAVEGVAQVGGAHLGHMLVTHVQIIIDTNVVLNVVAAVQAVDILGTRLNGVLLGQRTRPVELEGVLVEVLLAVLVDATVEYRQIEDVGIS